LRSLAASFNNYFEIERALGEGPRRGRAMEFGIFDHLDRNDRPLAQFYEERLKLIELYDRMGFYGYHLAEHHSTPLGMAPSPSVFLAAVAQRTRRLRFGPLVYILPLYHPLRLVEEICMLDQMSGGRLMLGVGRGISPYEVGYYGVDPAETQARYVETLDLILKALRSESLTFEGKFHRFKDVPMELAPVQKPHPPLWYGVINPDATPWLAKNRINIVSHVPAPVMGTITERYIAENRAAHGREAPLAKMGLGRHIVIAETSGEALALARRAYGRWYHSFTVLWKKHSSKPVSASYPENFDQLREMGTGIAGSPAEVRDVLLRQLGESGANYFVCRFAFGDLSFDEAQRSLKLFADQIMPAMAAKAAE
jgi:alkanesulfonate monooxygenase SsuD/methylene tetrahydromethanopterin reductase-like flavin-dependent oxidoreductase (luciferase family)